VQLQCHVPINILNTSIISPRIRLKCNDPTQEQFCAW